MSKRVEQAARRIEKTIEHEIRNLWALCRELREQNIKFSRRLSRKHQIFKAASIGTFVAVGVLCMFVAFFLYRTLPSLTGVR